ncbi:MAG: UvrD-helicase domain-containing protein [Candidatus Izemoplasmatales bacterium]
MRYTKSQEEAIYYQGKNVLVSASAGSGKTGVLKERVLQKLKLGYDIDQLVILTFTEAAAAEMKNRIVQEIHKENLTNQIEKIDNAIISTFDAFTLRVVKEYHYLLELDNDISISDEVIIKTQKYETIDNVLKGYYVENTDDFKVFFKKYFSKSDSWLKSSVYSVGEALRKLPNYSDVLDDYFNKYLNDGFLEDLAQKYIYNYLEELKNLYQGFREEFLENINIYPENYQEYLLNLDGLIKDVFSKKNSVDLYNKLSSISLPNKPRKSELVKPNIAKFLEEIGKDFKELFITEYTDIVNNFKTSTPSIIMLLKIVKDYLEEFEKVKLNNKLFSFDDIMFLAIKLFKEFSDVRLKFKESIKEILIDEYQDTNDLQDEFISLIANDNIFMVGDVKQSIYRFRDANPKNFMRIYEDYMNSSNGKAIFLQENFRSNDFILKAINSVFSKIMTSKVGGIDYKNEQVLITGFDESFPLHIDNAISYGLYDLEKIKEAYGELSKPEIEAHLVAQDIKKRISSNESIFDLKKNLKRVIKFEDITILVAQKSDFLTYSKIISNYNIPIDIYDDEPFFSSDEISFVFQYLLLIYCFKDNSYFKKYFKTALYAVARSFVYKIKDQTISELLTFKKFSDINDISCLDEYDEFRIIKDDISYVISNYWDFPPYKILEAVYEKTRIYRNIALLDNPSKKEEKLDFFLEKVGSFTEFTYKDLVEYLEIIINTNEFDIQYSEQKSNVNAVKLMSMHKSKGLQFPIVYLIGLYKRFHNPESKEPFIFNKDFGLLTRSYVDGFFNNYMRKLYFQEVEQENLSEKIRLLYVAMTRAINKIVVYLDYDETLLETNKKINSFKNIFYMTNNFDVDSIIDFKINDLSKSKETLENNQDMIKFKKFSFVKEPIKKANYSKTILNLLDDDIISVIDVGNEYHHLLETIDYYNVDESIFRFPIVLKEAINILVNSSLFKKLKKPNFYQEYEFYQETDSLVYRGVIDLLIIDEDCVYALDYKLKNIDDPAYESQLIGYYKFLEPKVDKPIKLFLFSLIDKVLKEVIL